MIPKDYMPLSFDPTKNFVGANGPIFQRIQGDNLSLGFRVSSGHCNLAGVCHGGMLMTLADSQISLGARHAARIAVILPTVSLSIEFITPVQNGSWVEGHTDMLRRTRNLVFAQCMLRVDSQLVVRASAVLKIGNMVEALSQLTTSETDNLPPVAVP